MAGTVTRTGFKNTLRFRLALYDSSGENAGQILVTFYVDHADLYVQEGDTVTLVGKWIAGSMVVNPFIINETARVLIPPSFDPAILVLAGAVLVAVSYLLIGHGAPLGIVLVGIAALVAYLTFRGVRGSLHIAAARERTAPWKKQTYQDPEGIIEGVTRFARGKQYPTNWVIFRIALHDRNGDMLDRLVGAMPESCDLRKGDVVRLPGTWTTGQIHRWKRVVNLSMRSDAKR
jgi:hypothetical protein